MISKGTPVQRHFRRLARIAAGSGLSFLGIVMIFTPGPAFLVLPCGLYLLGREFVWAERLHNRLIKALPARIQNRYLQVVPLESIVRNGDLHTRRAPFGDGGQ